MFKIQPATEDQVQLVLDFIMELAVYEKLEHTVTATTDKLRESLFGPKPSAYALFAYLEDEPCGMAIYFYNFSTFTGFKGLYLEDLFVRPQHRGKGLGKLFFKHLAQIAVQERCSRFEWQVLDWNQSARDFYKRMGSEEGLEWVSNRLSGQALKDLAEMN